MIRTLLLFLFFFTSCVEDETQHVKKAFSDYTEAILKNDGNTAAKIVDNATVEYYNNLKESAFTLDSVDIERLRATDKTQLIFIKHLIPKERLKEFNGLQIFDYLVSNGAIKPTNISDQRIQEVVVNNSTATLKLINSKTKATINFYLVKENGIWKLSILKLFSTFDELISQALDSKSAEEQHQIFTAMCMNINGIYPSDSIWHAYK